MDEKLYKATCSQSMGQNTGATLRRDHFTKNMFCFRGTGKKMQSLIDCVN